jgi:plastocyanin
MNEDNVTTMETPAKRRHWVWVIIALVVIGGVILAVNLARQPHQQPVSSAAPAVVINITDHGFVPATLVVDAGTKVTWHNQTASPHQVGSNPYPGHTDLPGLYSASAIGPDETYSYTFSQTGTFGYSDYTNPTVGGTVTVK